MADLYHSTRIHGATNDCVCGPFGNRQRLPSEHGFINVGRPRNHLPVCWDSGTRQHLQFYEAIVASIQSLPKFKLREKILNLPGHVLRLKSELEQWHGMMLGSNEILTCPFKMESSLSPFFLIIGSTGSALRTSWQGQNSAWMYLAGDWI